MTNQFASPNDPDAPIVRIDDVGNNDATTTSLIVGLPARAAIDYVGDVDWFKVDFDALTTYQITLKGSASGGGTLPSGTSVTLSTVQVWDPATRSYLYGGYGNAGEPNLSVPIEKAGTYFVAVSANYVTGSYTLQAAALLHDDYTGNGYNALDKSLGSFHANFDYAGDNDADALTDSFLVAHRWNRPWVEMIDDAAYQAQVSKLAAHDIRTWVNTHGPIYTGDPQWFSDNIPCMTACPSHTDISRYIALIADGRYADSFELNREHNVFPGCLGRMCARPCEQVTSGHGHWWSSPVLF